MPEKKTISRDYPLAASPSPKPISDTSGNVSYQRGKYEKLDIDTSGYASGKKYPYSAKSISLPRGYKKTSDTTPVHVNRNMVTQALKQKRN